MLRFARLLSCPALILLCGAALADPPPSDPPPSEPSPTPLPLGKPLTGAEFEAYATGKTLTYSDGGAVWGREQYLPGRQVIWAFAGADCEYGTWTEVTLPEAGPAVCFTYEDHPEDVNCWQFYHGPKGLVAQFLDGGAPLSELGQSPQPMECQGPGVGA